MTDINILIVDDQKLMLELLSQELKSKSGFQVVALATGEKEMLNALKKYRVDLILLDVELPASSGRDGFQLAEMLKSDFPLIKIISISYNTRTATLHQLLEVIKVNGFIDKNDTTVRRLVQAIRMVMNGGIYTSPNLKSRVAHALDIPSLADEEFKVMKLIVKGHTNKQIATQLNKSVSTVDNQRTTILQKLKSKNTAEATAVFLKHFFLHQDDPESLPNFKKTFTD